MGVRALPSAVELADVYSENELQHLHSLARTVDDHDARSVLLDAIRVQQRRLLGVALGEGLRARLEAMQQAEAAEKLELLGFDDDPAAAPPCVASEQSASPSE
jgi:hypothetical protein